MPINLCAMVQSDLRNVLKIHCFVAIIKDMFNSLTSVIPNEINNELTIAGTMHNILLAFSKCTLKFVELTFEIPTVRGQRHSFATHERMFL